MSAKPPPINLQEDAEGKLYSLARLTMSSSMILDLPVQVACSAILYFRKFYADYSLDDYDPIVMVQSAIMLAAKAHEHPRRLRDIVTVVYHLINSKDGTPTVPSNSQYWTYKPLLIEMEHYLLRALRFDVELDLPHNYVLHFARYLELDTHLATASFYFCTDFFVTDAVLTHNAQTLATAAILLSAHMYEGRVFDAPSREWNPQPMTTYNSGFIASSAAASTPATTPHTSHTSQSQWSAAPSYSYSSSSFNHLTAVTPRPHAPSASYTPTPNHISSASLSSLSMSSPGIASYASNSASAPVPPLASAPKPTPLPVPFADSAPTAPAAPTARTSTSSSPPLGPSWTRTASLPDTAPPAPRPTALHPLTGTVIGQRPDLSVATLCARCAVSREAVEAAVDTLLAAYDLPHVSLLGRMRRAR